MSAGTGFAPDAAMVLGIAATAMPFARTPQDEAERWLRILRLHGDVGATLQGLGVSEGSLKVVGEAGTAAPEAGERAASSDAGQRDVVSQVNEHAAQRAAGRAAAEVTTTDVLMAVMQVYGVDFDAVLRAHGTDRREVLRRLGGEGSSS